MNRLFTLLCKKQTLLLLLLVTGLSEAAKAQSASVKKSWAFAKEMTYGRELRDFNGNPVAREDTAYFLYMETNGKNRPTINNISYRGRTFQAAVHPVTDAQVVAGTEAKTNKEIILKKGAANYLWLVELTPADGGVKTSSKASMVVNGTIGKKPFTLRFQRLVLLLADIKG